MGTWGVGLYANDTASDTRDRWLKKLKQGATGEQATAELIAEIKGIDEEPLFWLALADTQWTWGRLESPVLERAQRVLADGGDLTLWDERGQRRARARVFDRLAARLKQPPPPPKKVRIVGDALPWKRGQLWAYHTLDDKYVVLRIAAFDPTCGLVGAPVTELLDVVLDALPTAAALADVGVKAARADYNASGRYDFFEPEFRASPIFEPKVKRRGELPRHRLRALPAQGTPRAATAESRTVGVPWDGLDDFLARMFAVGALRPGAVLRWALADGDVAYTMVEFGHWEDTLIRPMWQLAVLDCRGDGVDAAAIGRASVVRSIIVEGFQPPALREIAFRPIESADEIFGNVYQWEEVPETLASRRSYRPADLNAKEAQEVLDTYLEQRYRPRSHAEVVTMLGAQEIDRVTGPSGVPYVIQIRIHWARRPGGAVWVSGALDDGRAEQPIFPFRRSIYVKKTRRTRQA